MTTTANTTRIPTTTRNRKRCAHGAFHPCTSAAPPLADYSRTEPLHAMQRPHDCRLHPSAIRSHTPMHRRSQLVRIITPFILLAARIRAPSQTICAVYQRYIYFTAHETKDQVHHQPTASEGPVAAPARDEWDTPLFTCAPRSTHPTAPSALKPSAGAVDEPDLPQHSVCNPDTRSHLSLTQIAHSRTTHSLSTHHHWVSSNTEVNFPVLFPAYEFQSPHHKTSDGNRQSHCSPFFNHQSHRFRTFSPQNIFIQSVAPTDPENELR